MVDAITALGAVVVVISGFLPVLLIVFFPVLFATAIVMKWYVRTARELKRLDSTTRSPVYSNFSQALDGLATAQRNVSLVRLAL